MNTPTTVTILLLTRLLYRLNNDVDNMKQTRISRKMGIILAILVVIAAAQYGDAIRINMKMISRYTICYQ